jgi:exonuclease SbcC
MDDLKSRIDQLDRVEGADCPLCGQPLSILDRERLLLTLNDQGLAMGDQHRSNQGVLRELAEEIKELETGIRELAQAEAQLIVYKQSQARILTRMEVFEGQVKDWERDGAPRLAEIESLLAQEAYAGEARRQLQEIDQELRSIGYDAAAHDAARQSEIEMRSSEADMRALEKARATLVPLEREIADLEARISAQHAESDRQADEFERLKVEFESRLATAPDLELEEQALLSLQEAENSLRLELGAAQQKVLVLDDLKIRRKALEAQREELAQRIGQYRQLERAFSRDGVPALLIEQALPEIETRANELLDRLSAGGMSVRFVTQAAYKDKHRADLRETLDIQISDGVGTRDYEMYSGGEAFRVNFAIRLALSGVLAQRAGARLQTLVIDEGFGSQDTQGRQRLVEAINLVRPDFAKVLVITHIDELKDAFPTRIEVEKTPHGSAVRVV